MPVISGPITALAGDSTARVYVAATEVHPHAGGVMTDEPCRVSITNGVLSFEAPEGVGVLTIKTAGGVEKTLPIVVKEGYTLADALLAGDVEALPASKIDELAERLAGMAAGDQADLTGKLEETGDGELTIGAGYSHVNIGSGGASVVLPINTRLENDAASVYNLFNYVNRSLAALFKDAEVIPLPPSNSGIFLENVLNAKGLYITSVQTLPFKVDPQSCVSVNGIFQGYQALKEVGDFNMSICEDFAYMFSGCRSLERVGKITVGRFVEELDFSYMFANCSALTDGAVKIICTPEQARAATTTGMLINSGLTKKPFYTSMGSPIDVP